MTLKRSNSERQTSRRTGVHFNDTMAIRTTTNGTKNVIVRELFHKIDPDKLDGTSKNQNILKPARHAPPPPSQLTPPTSPLISIETKYKITPKSKTRNSQVERKIAEADKKEILRKNEEIEQVCEDTRKSVDVERNDNSVQKNFPKKTSDVKKKNSMTVKKNESLGKSNAVTSSKNNEMPRKKIDNHTAKTSGTVKRKDSSVTDATTKSTKSISSNALGESLKMNARTVSTSNNTQFNLARETSEHANVANVKEAQENPKMNNNQINLIDKLNEESSSIPPAAPPRKRSNNKSNSPLIMSDIVSTIVSSDSRFSFDTDASSSIETMSHVLLNNIVPESINGKYNSVEELKYFKVRPLIKIHTIKLLQVTREKLANLRLPQRLVFMILIYKSSRKNLPKSLYKLEVTKEILSVR